MLLQPAPNAGIGLRLGRQNQGHFARRQFYQLGVEQIALHRISKADAIGRDDDDLRLGHFFPNGCISGFRLFKRLFMGEKKAFIRHCDHIIVEGPSRNRDFGLLDEEGVRRIKLVRPRNGFRRLEMLARGEGATGFAIDKDFQPRLAM